MYPKSVSMGEENVVMVWLLISEMLVLEMIQ